MPLPPRIRAMRPRLACTNCRVRKKKCNKAYPSYSYCLKTHDKCPYRAAVNANSTIIAIEIEAPSTYRGRTTQEKPCDNLTDDRMLR
ncbi:hypothetical protein AC578_5704 [Pseudocercospora eumusae]|uniref:Zn(2)-C6 fungal-type domain-containing protein n=1 Tax=Pseudocercospora eumusae TaxID=321146 RepID=A0A139HET3_9PEZI|nr:hypothetical protein AC578_5704 [Pseudocercospora eumusae]